MEKYTYEVIEDLNIILRSDGASIPKDPANSDYQRYLNPEVEQLTEIPTPLAE
jgi:hypothetical protein